MVAAVFSDHTTFVHCITGNFFPILMLSGILWPLEGMPPFLQKICWWLPNTYTAQAMRDVMTKGWDTDYHTVQKGILVILAWIVIFNTKTLIVLKMKAP